MDEKLIKDFLLENRNNLNTSKETSIEYLAKLNYCLDKGYIIPDGNGYRIHSKGEEFLTGIKETSFIHIGHNIEGNIHKSDLSLSDFNFSITAPNKTHTKQNQIVSKLKLILKWIWTHIWQITSAFIAGYLLYRFGFQ